MSYTAALAQAKFVPTATLVLCLEGQVGKAIKVAVQKKRTYEITLDEVSSPKVGVVFVSGRKPDGDRWETTTRRAGHVSGNGRVFEVAGAWLALDPRE